MAEGRVVIGGQPRGAAFLIGPDLAITARHVIKDALDSGGNPKQGLEFTLELQDGSPRVAVVEASDPILDVASVRIAEPSAEWFRTGVPTKDVAWEVTTRFLSADPVLTGTIVDPARPIRNNTDHETALIQLDVKQSLGSYEGYSGSPVCVQTTRPGSAPSPVAVGVLVEQGLWRTQKEPGQRQATVANVLWAAPFPAVLDALGLSPEVRPYGDWTLISPERAFFWTMEVDPVNPLTIYASMSHGQEMYRSSDGGRYWEPMNVGFSDVQDIAVSPFDSSLHVGTYNGLWISNDRGVTWRENRDFHGKCVLSIALSPHDQKIQLIGCGSKGGMSFRATSTISLTSATPALRSHEGLEDSGLKFSRDDGKTWVTFPTPNNINSLWIDPEDSRIYAVASATDGVFFSRQGPEKLRRVEAFPAGQKPLCIAMLPGDPDRLLVGTKHGGLYWSSDDGANWERGNGIPDVQVTDIRFLPGTPSRVMAATRSGPFESDDGGTLWHRSARGLDYEFSIVLAPLADGSVILGTNGGGAYRRAAGQSTWNPSNRGFPPAVATGLTQAGGWLLAGAAGLLRSPDDGASWRYSGLAGEQLFAIAVESGWAKEDSHSRTTRGGLFVSREGLGPSKPAVLRDDPPAEVLIGTTTGGLFRSRDSGASWETLTTPTDWAHRPIRSITLSSGVTPRIGVLVQGEGFFISDDAGRSWSAEASDVLGTNIQFAVASKHDDCRLFALTHDRGTFLSEDSGTTWTECAGLPSREVFVAIAEPDDDAEVVFAASLLRSVYRSADAGRTFSRIGSVDLPADTDPDKLRWTTLIIRSHPDALGTLVLGSSLGAYLSQDEGRTWKPLPAGILKNNYKVQDLLLTGHGTRILMATTQGIFMQELPP